MTSASRRSILIVEDEQGLADLYGMWLGEEYDAVSVYNGRDAIDQFDQTVDIVLLDRRMPGLSGDEVLEHIRNQGSDCRVAMVTGIQPDFDIIDMGLDDYLVKPVDREELTELVTRLHRQATYDTRLQESYRLWAKKQVLETVKSDQELAQHEEFVMLQQRLFELRETLDATLDTVETDSFIQEFQQISPRREEDS